MSRGNKICIVLAVAGAIFLILNFGAVVVLGIKVVLWVIATVFSVILHAIRLCWPILVATSVIILKTSFVILKIVFEVLKVSLIIVREALLIAGLVSFKAIEYTCNLIAYVSPFIWRAFCGFGSFVRSIMSPKFIWQRQEFISEASRHWTRSVLEWVSNCGRYLLASGVDDFMWE